MYRRDRVRYPSLSVFNDLGDPSWFAVRYFNQFSEYQGINDDILNRGIHNREAKMRELGQKQDQYHYPIQLYDQSSCEYYEVIMNCRKGVQEKRHSTHCTRCSYKSRTSGIDIDIHKGPLSRSDLEAKATVFELSLPPFYGYWRDKALFLFTDVFKINSSSARAPRVYHPLRTYSGLSYFYDSYSL